MAEILETAAPPPHNGLWHPRRGKPSVRSYGSLRRVREMTVLERADQDRKALHAIISFPDEGYCYVIEDARQLEVIIQKLEAAYRHLTGRGQSTIVSLSSDPALDGSA